jgi:hypothetical protein
MEIFHSYVTYQRVNVAQDRLQERFPDVGWEPKVGRFVCWDDLWVTKGNLKPSWANHVKPVIDTISTFQGIQYLTWECIPQRPACLPGPLC